MMTHWLADPFEEMRALQRQINRVFDSYTRDIQGEKSSSSSEMITWRPTIDVKEDDKNITVHAEVPGVPKENINIDFENGNLTISGERKHEKKEENEHYHRIERMYGRFSRTIAVPENIDPKTIVANYKDGVLEIILPKPQESQPKSTKIQIK
jgi:HSP20 family protein